MPELKFKQLVIFGHPGTVADFDIDGQKVTVQLTEGEENEIRAVAFHAYERNRADLANAILSAQPALLMPPQTIDAKWEEVPEYIHNDSDDDVRF